MLRRLRIAASMLFAILTLALCVLWMRSYYDCDQLQVYCGRAFTFRSKQGIVAFVVSPPFVKGVVQVLELGMSAADPIFAIPISGRSAGSIAYHGFYWYYGTNGQIEANSPFWLPVLLSGSAVLCMNWSWRFSIRTMMIATTLIAFGLGIFAIVHR